MMSILLKINLWLWHLDKSSSVNDYMGALDSAKERAQKDCDISFYVKSQIVMGNLLDFHATIFLHV